MSLSLEVTFPCNWYFEPEADLLWVGDGSEQRYAGITQGSTVTQATYAGHRWVVRAKVSREVLADVTLVETLSGVQHVDLGGSPGITDVVRAVIRIGGCAKELVAKTSAPLLKLLTNVVQAPQQAKYRSLRAANPTIAAVLDAPGALALLGAAGFEEQIAPPGTVEAGSASASQMVETRVVLPNSAALGPVKDAVEALQRLTLLLNGGALSPPDGAPPVVAGGGAGASTAPEASHRCAACRRGIENDLRRALAGSGEVGGWRTHTFNAAGEYRFHCATCNVDLCSECYDRWKGGGARAEAIHPAAHALAVVAPITTPWRGFVLREQSSPAAR